MRRPPATLAALATLAACVACKQQRPPPSADAAPRLGGVVVRDAKGAVLVAFTPAGSGEWDVAPAGQSVSHISKRDGDLVMQDPTGGHLATLTAPELADTPGARILWDAGGNLVARLLPPNADRLTLVKPDGVALVTIRNDAQGATARDAAGVPVLSARVEGDRILILARDGTRLATVQGSIDQRLAALVALTSLPWEQRAVLLAALK